MRILISVVFLLFWSFLLQAQSYTFNEQIRGVDLPSETIRGLLQDTKGRMWFNTSMGFYYSDGFSTFPVPSSIQDQLSNDSGMFQDKDGWIWFFNNTKGAKIFYYDQVAWNELELPEQIVINATELYKKLVVFGSGEEKQIVIIDEQRLYKLNSAKATWSSYDLPVDQVGVYYSYWEENEVSWIFFEHATVSLTDDGLKFVEIHNPFGGARIYHVVKDRDMYYFLGRDFLASSTTLDRVENILISGFEEPKYTVIDYSFLQVDSGSLYFFFNSQLLKYNPQSDRLIKIETIESLRSYSLTAALIDREGIIWLASTRGLVNILSLMFVNYSRKEFIDDEVTAIHEIRDNQFLLGFNNGLQLWDEKGSEVIQHFPQLLNQPQNRITNIVSDQKGQIWLSSNKQGVGKFSIKDRSVKFVNTSDKVDVIGVFPIRDSLYISAKNRLFLASITEDEGKLFANEVTEEWKKASGLKEFYIRKIGELRDKRLMVLLGGNVFTNDSVTVRSKQVFVVGFDYLELDSFILVGTDKGLKKLDEKGLSDFIWKGQSIARPVYALSQDSKGRVWVGTDKGVFVANENGFRNFEEKSGLAGTEINRGAQILTRSGQMIIGTHKGMSVFNPLDENPVIPVPHVEITSLAVLNADQETLDLRQIQPNTNFIEVKYLVPSFLQNLDYEVLYFLEGFHESWVQVVNPRTNSITFSNLPPGTYRFHMKVRLGNEVESDVVSSSEFIILKPVYLRLWFILTVLFIFFLIGYLVRSLLTQVKEKGVLKQAIDEKIYEASVTEEQFKNVWLSSKDGLSLTLEDGRIIAVNPALAKLVGVSEHELERMYLWEMFSEQDFYERERKRIEKIIESKGSTTYNLEIEMPLKTGVKIIDYFSTELKSAFNGKRVFLSVFSDITKQRKQELRLKAAKEKAEEASRLKSSFLSNMSHEIRTPLNGILGMAEHILQQRSDEEELVSQLEIIKESGERLLHTINSILDLSKIEANKMDVLYEETNINDFVARVLLPLKAIAIKKDLLLTVKYESKKLIGKIDRRYLEMIINNLVGNAIKYSTQGLISVRVGKENGALMIQVEDQGIGMSEDFLNRIFNPFEQESNGYVREYEGTGLGLTITKSLIDLLGGRITIDSQKGKGTQVVVTLPIS